MNCNWRDCYVVGSQGRGRSIPNGKDLNQTGIDLEHASQLIWEERDQLSCQDTIVNDLIVGNMLKPQHHIERVGGDVWVEVGDHNVGE